MPLFPSKSIYSSYCGINSIEVTYMISEEEWNWEEDDDKNDDDEDW